MVVSVIPYPFTNCILGNLWYHFSKYLGNKDSPPKMTYRNFKSTSPVGRLPIIFKKEEGV